MGVPDRGGVAQGIGPVLRCPLSPAIRRPSGNDPRRPRGSLRENAQVPADEIDVSRRRPREEAARGLRYPGATLAPW
jgi:hypothetical protein